MPVPGFQPISGSTPVATGPPQPLPFAAPRSTSLLAASSHDSALPVAFSPRSPLTTSAATLQSPASLQEAPVLTQDNVVTLVLICCVLVFYAIEQLARFAVHRTAAAALQTVTPDAAQLCKYARAAAAALILRFVSLLVKVAAALALTLGVVKAFAPLATLVLPEKAFGLLVLISYCGLIAVVKVLAEDMRDGIKRIVAPMFGGSEAPQPPKRP